jgi:FkbM family methyltransferase
MRRLLPKRLTQAARTAVRAPVYVRLAADLGTARALARLENSTTRWRPGERVALRLRELGGRALEVRPTSADRWVVIDTFVDGAHLPPDSVRPADARVVWDLGAHIGSTAVHLAARLPRATVVALEPDPGNAAMARRNAAAWDGRVVVLEGAAWFEDGEVAFAERPGDELAGRVLPGGNGDHRATAYSLDTLLAEHTPGDDVDYVKMDVEGAERELLRRNTGWAAHVRAIKIEVHPPYTVDECLADLTVLGFEARLAGPVAQGPGMPEVVGIR